MLATMLLTAALSLPGALREAPGADPYSVADGARISSESREIERVAVKPVPTKPRAVVVVRARPATAAKVTPVTIAEAAVARASSVLSGMLRRTCDDSSVPSASPCTSSCAPSSRCSCSSRAVQS